MGRLDGKVALITGGARGMGKSHVRHFVAEGARVVFGDVRDDQGKYVAAGLGEGACRYLHHDVTSADDWAAAVALAQDAFGRLDVLVNNAGIGHAVPGDGARQESADGYELRFAVNYLAGYALTRLLLPLLTASAPARVVNVASLGQQAIDFDDVMLTRAYDGFRAYRQSKLAQILFTFDLAGEIAGTGVTVSALHPATFMPTKIVAGDPIATIAQGVAATARQVAAPAEQVSGRFFNGPDEARANDQAYDAAARRRLRELSRELTGL
jgi:NAD(P)-dependent dehydrogenase (short-subunit alcohol dehydrogenase family)